MANDGGGSQKNGSIKITGTGPYMVRGGLPLQSGGTAVETRPNYALCRCGLSAKKPFCDGSHSRGAFDGKEAAPPPADAQGGANPAADAGIEVLQAGPLCVRGNVPLTGAEGGEYPADPEMYLCRCGLSANKPFCDGSHNGSGRLDPKA